MFADAFFGAGAVSVAAKAYGFGHVASNDLAGRSQTIGRALVSNSSCRLDPARVLNLFGPAPDPGLGRPSVLDRLAPQVAQVFENAWQHLHGGTYVSTEGDLIATLILKQLLTAFPMSLPTASDAPRIAAGFYDPVSNPRLAHYLRARNALTSPRRWLGAADRLNAAILPGHGTVSGLDAVAFLRKTAATVAHLDPPYAQTQGYERAFALVDDFLGLPLLSPSRFSSRTPPLDDLLDACAHIPVVVLSFNNTVLDQSDLERIVARHRKVARFVSIPYRHYGSVASSEKNHTNREFLILGVK